MQKGKSDNTTGKQLPESSTATNGAHKLARADNSKHKKQRFG
jgi:hypothetical protein